MTAPWRAHAWQAQSLLLAYPDEDFAARAALTRRVLPWLPTPVADPLRDFLDQVQDVPPLDVAAAYVETFDHHRRCSPHLTYFSHGDTRQRGAALLGLKQTYRRAGLPPDDGELPDHLAVVLEFAAARPAAGHELLTRHRAGVELLRLALRDRRSPWAAVLVSVSATLPALSGDERTAVARLAAAGPPREQVGLAPYPPPGTATAAHPGGR